ncbi:MAG: hypothetical protein J5629_02290 [Muribaculaceae bacterium]|nr:hypothetical protein [Muribaculaceae bacterium]
MNAEDQKRRNRLNLTMVGAVYEYSEEFGAPEGDPINEVLEALEFPLCETLTAIGIVVYTDGKTSIVRVTSMYQELQESYALRYKEIKDRYPDFEDPKHTQLTDYLCLDVENEVSLYWRDNDGTLYPAIFDEDHFFNGYDIPEDFYNESIDLTMYNEKIEAFRDQLLDSDAETRQRIRKKVLDFSGRKDEVPKLDKKGFVISLPGSTIIELVKKDAIVEPLFHGISRAGYWLMNNDCAILTTWRADKKREQKNEDNRKLVADLRELGYGVKKIRGCYVNSNNEINKENSFLVINFSDNSDNFFDAIFRFSENYQQECFLYKSKDDETAYLVGTSDEFKYGRGKIVAAGTLHINNMSAENFSLIGSGQISFE